MKKSLLFLAPLMFAANCMAAGSGGDTVKLPEPDKNVSMTLFDALQNRQSVREFSDKAIDKATLSSLLWAATGVNRPDGRMTAPTAVNAQDISVYVATKDGVSLYMPKENSLKSITKKDIRADLAGRQKNVANAPVFLLIVSDTGKFRWTDGTEKTFAAMDASYVSQNIDLASVALGLATVPRYMMEREAVSKALNLGEKQLPMLNHPIGYPVQDTGKDDKNATKTEKGK